MVNRNHLDLEVPAEFGTKDVDADERGCSCVAGGILLVFHAPNVSQLQIS